VREGGQSDVDAQRDRYLEYDSGNYPGAEIQRLEKPFGYRLNHDGKNKVLIRCFLTDGSDGLVVSMSSRLQNFDAWAEKVFAILLSVKISGGGGITRQPERAGPALRRFGKKGIVSVVAPGVWKPLTPEEDNELLVLGLKGTRSGPVITVIDEGEPTNPNLVLVSLSTTWKKSYGHVVAKRVGAKPPALMVKNRKPGSVDYILAFAAGSHGYTLRLNVREGGYERMKSLLDDMARSIVLMGGEYKPAKDLPGLVTVDYKKQYVVHAKAERADAAEKAKKLISGFEKHWSRIGVGSRRKPPPIHIVIVEEEDFDEQSHGFGDLPVAYDRLDCAVVALPPPSDKQALPNWKGRFYAALAAASLQRDLAVAAPPWLLVGLCTCMDAAGRSGKGPDEAHPAYVQLLDTKTATDSQAKLTEVLNYTYGDVLQAETPANATMAWGYTHLLLFGRSSLSSTYRNWVKALEKRKRGEAPYFDPGKYDRAEEDLKKHVLRTWGQ
jgi:hypothetical protein